MRTLAALVLLFAVPLASGTFQPTRDVDFWRRAGFDLAQAQRFFSNSICYSRESLYDACREGFLQAGASLHSGEFAYLSNTNFATAPRVDFDALLKRVNELSAQRPGRESVFAAMVNALLRQFDAHALLLPIEQIHALTESGTQETTGIGAEEEVSDGGLFIRRIYTASPAAAAGLKVNDRVLSIQGVKVKPGLKALHALRGLAQPAGAAVDLVVARDGQPLALRVLVGHLDLQDAETQIVQFQPAKGQHAVNYAVARVRTFGHGVCQLLTRQLQAVVERGVQGVILDLRFNMGGALDEAACVLSLFSQDQRFVEKRPIESELPKELGLQLTFDANDQQRWRLGLAPTRWPDLPLTVVVNSTTASAAEMLAAALQDAKRAWVVGDITFGKGSTQGQAAQSFNPNVRLLYTVSRYYRPNGAPLQLIGVTPDLVVPSQRQATLPERVFPREGELFGTHLMPEASPPWTQPRPQEFAKLRSCMRAQHAEDWFARAYQKQAGFEDFQLASAVAALHCQR